jgi:hypothetical protein
MAPEVARSDNYAFSADIYSFASFMGNMHPPNGIC